MFFCGFTSVAKSFIGSPALVNTWQCVHVTPSAALNCRITTNTCSRDQSFGST